jgi:hypothetical protein
VTTTVAGAAGIYLLLSHGFAPPANGQWFAPPSPRAEQALASLSAPSYPAALPGSLIIERGLFLRPGLCAEAKGAYRRAGAPLPPGARILAYKATGAESTTPERSQVALLKDVLVVETEHGSSGIFFTDHPAGCFYRIVTAPTLQIRGPPGVPSGETFAPVACTGQGKDREILASGDIGAKPHVLFVGESEDEELTGMVGRVVQGTLQQTRAQDESGALPAPWPATVSERPDGILAITLASEAGPVRIRVNCKAGGAAIFRVLGVPRTNERKKPFSARSESP